MISLREFAKLAGTSPATVSRTFSGSERISKKTKERLFKLADRYNFRPSAIRPAAIGGRTKSVGVIIPNLAISYFANIVAGIQKELLKKDYLAIIVDLENDNEGKLVNRLIDHRVDGLIINLVTETLSRRDFANLLHLNIPIVLLGPTMAGFDADIIDNADVKGGKMATEHLIELGHRRIGFCTFGEGINSSCNQRFAGFSQALEKHNLELRECDIAHRQFDVDDSDSEFRKDLIRILSDNNNRPTAFFAPTDLIALDLYSVAKELNIKIPEELSIVGYADLNFAPYVDPPLTTIRQDGVTMGIEAAKLVLNHLDDPSRKSKQIIIPTELIVRQSTIKNIQLVRH